jgi:hypothetical protein
LARYGAFSLRSALPNANAASLQAGLNLPWLNNGMNMNFASAGDMGNTVLL